MSLKKYTVESVGPKLDEFLRPLLKRAAFALDYDLTEGESVHPEYESPEVTVKFRGADVDLLLLLERVHITGDVQVILGPAVNEPFRARIGNHAARALAGRASSSNAEEALLISHLAATVACAALYWSSARSRSRSAAKARDA